MKKFLVITLLILIASFIFAHPASEVDLKYDTKTSMLTINVAHQISNTKAPDPMKHFIKEITVSVNGKEVIVETIAFQQSDEGEICSFLLNVKPNDEVAVKTVCSITGIKISKITIK